MPVSEELFKSAMRYFPASVNIVTCASDGEFRGMTATAVCSLCAKPVPSLLVCINQSGMTYPSLKKTGAFAVNVLNSEQKDIAQAFASSDPDKRSQRFKQGDWEPLGSGAPALKDAVITFDCSLSQEIEHGTHSILVGTVLNIRTDSEKSNLLYVGGRFAQLKENEPA